MGDTWRDLALKFDNHRMQAIWHLKALLQSQEHTAAAYSFLEQSPDKSDEVAAKLLEEQNDLKEILQVTRDYRDAAQYQLKECRYDLSRALKLLSKLDVHNMPDKDFQNECQKLLVGYNHE